LTSDPFDETRLHHPSRYHDIFYNTSFTVLFSISCIFYQGLKKGYTSQFLDKRSTLHSQPSDLTVPKHNYTRPLGTCVGSPCRQIVVTDGGWRESLGSVRIISVIAGFWVNAGNSQKRLQQTILLASSPSLENFSTYQTLFWSSLSKSSVAGAKIHALPLLFSAMI
jgi:hypothetical protein